MSKKIKQNRYKPGPEDGKSGILADSGHAIDFCLKCIMIVVSISVLSLTSIFAYDFCTQSGFFNIKTIEITGSNRVDKQQVLESAGLTGQENIFGINLHTIKKRIEDHPWIQSATVKRGFKSRLKIHIVEHAPLAIVKIENLTDIVINTQGTPFKEYNPLKDHLENLPVISGLDLTTQDNQFKFYGPLFDAVMNLLNENNPGNLKHNLKSIRGDKNTGLVIEVTDIYNPMPENSEAMIQLKLGFNDFKAKLDKAKKISRYIDKNFPNRDICTMDLFNIQKVFIKTKLADTLHNNFEKGV